MNNNRRNNDRENEAQGTWSMGSLIAGIAGVAALAGGVYYVTKKSEENAENKSKQYNPGNPAHTPYTYESDSSDSADEGITLESARVRSVPDSAIVNNLNSLLDAIYVRYISIKLEEFSLYYNVLNHVLYNLHYTMKTVDPYYKRFSSTLSHAGSHYDGAPIDKPDEFDMDIVIRMPIDYSINRYNPSDSDINFVAQDSGYVQLKMGSQFIYLPKRDPQDWYINKTAYNWMDSGGFLSRAKFLDWFKGIVDRALNKFDRNENNAPIYRIDGVTYGISRSESGPAITLVIQNAAAGFKLCFDLVPALRFPETRWPINEEYRDIPASCVKDYWMVVPKPNKTDPSDRDRMTRSWRFALQHQERQLMYNRYNLKQALRLMKKLRDARGMKCIASYYIKTLFFWEIVAQENNPLFWRQSSGKLFTIMVNRLYEAVERGCIPYFWNENNNLLVNVRRTVLTVYQNILRNLISVLNDPLRYRTVADYLLTSSEFDDFKRRFD